MIDYTVFFTHIAQDGYANSLTIDSVLYTGNVNTRSLLINVSTNSVSYNLANTTNEYKPETNAIQLAEESSIDVSINYKKAINILEESKDDYAISSQSKIIIQADSAALPLGSSLSINNSYNLATTVCEVSSYKAEQLLPIIPLDGQLSYVFDANTFVSAANLLSLYNTKTTQLSSDTQPVYNTMSQSITVDEDIEESSIYDITQEQVELNVINRQLLLNNLPNEQCTIALETNNVTYFLLYLPDANRGYLPKAIINDSIDVTKLEEVAWAIFALNNNTKYNYYLTSILKEIVYKNKMYITEYNLPCISSEVPRLDIAIIKADESIETYKIALLGVAILEYIKSHQGSNSNDKLLLDLLEVCKNIKDTLLPLIDTEGYVYTSRTKEYINYEQNLKATLISFLFLNEYLAIDYSLDLYLATTKCELLLKLKESANRYEFITAGAITELAMYALYTSNDVIKDYVATVLTTTPLDQLLKGYILEDPQLDLSSYTIFGDHLYGTTDPDYYLSTYSLLDPTTFFITKGAIHSVGLKLLLAKRLLFTTSLDLLPKSNYWFSETPTITSDLLDAITTTLSFGYLELWYHQLGAQPLSSWGEHLRHWARLLGLTVTPFHTDHQLRSLIQRRLSNQELLTQTGEFIKGIDLQLNNIKYYILIEPVNTETELYIPIEILFDSIKDLLQNIIFPIVFNNYKITVTQGEEVQIRRVLPPVLYYLDSNKEYQPVDILRLVGSTFFDIDNPIDKTLLEFRLPAGYNYQFRYNIIGTQIIFSNNI